jgi:hypothetical protein
VRVAVAGAPTKMRNAGARAPPLERPPWPSAMGALCSGRPEPKPRRAPRSLGPSEASHAACFPGGPAVEPRRRCQPPPPRARPPRRARTPSRRRPRVSASRSPGVERAACPKSRRALWFRFLAPGRRCSPPPPPRPSTAALPFVVAVPVTSPPEPPQHHLP